jgi:Domain of unknown function (DUF1996)
MKKAHPISRGHRLLAVAALALVGAGCTAATVAKTATIPGNNPAPGGGTSGSVAPIASNFDVNAYLKAGRVPPSSAAEPTGNFRTICNFSHLGYNDPIVYPGQPGMSHLHMFFGNTATNANSTYASLRTSGDSTCQGGPINRTAYWAPAVINTAGKVVVPDYAIVYYKGFGTTASISQIKDMPAGLKMIAGYNMAAPGGATHFDWYCETTQNKQQTIPTCPTGERVGVTLRFPNCWDGKNLDSADHRSHLAYTVNHDFSGICPSSHPVQLPQITESFWFPNDGNSANWYLSSDRMPGMTHANGTTFHADWFGAWDPTIQNTLITKCISGMLNCQDGEIGDGRQLVQAKPYTGSKILDMPAR